MKLIDADKLKKEITNQPPELYYNCYFIEKIDNQPEIKIKNGYITGEWLINFDGYYPYCSNCHNEPQNKVMTKFCPNCGAYMKNDKQSKQQQLISELKKLRKQDNVEANKMLDACIDKIKNFKEK